MLKKSFFIVVYCLYGILGLSPNAYADQQVSVLLLGDSLSAGYGLKQDQAWPYILNQQFQKDKSPYHIINASISGETTGGGLSRLPAILEKKSFDWLLIALGGNDGLRGFPPALIKKNLMLMIEQAKAKKINVAIMAIQIPPNYGQRYNKMFVDVFHQVANEQHVLLMPFFMAEVAINPALMQADGIHPNLKAQPLIVDFMSQQLKNLPSPLKLEQEK